MVRKKVQIFPIQVAVAFERNKTKKDCDINKTQRDMNLISARDYCDESKIYRLDINVLQKSYNFKNSSCNLFSVNQLTDISI